MIYLDSNGTTIMPAKVIQEINNWFNKGNPSADYPSACQSQELIQKAREFIAKNCNFSLNHYEVLFTSCASESNSWIIKSTAYSYKNSTGKIPHIITTAVEHKASLLACEELHHMNLAHITYIQPNIYGAVDPQDVINAIRHNTALISIIHVNNELGIVNNILDIVKHAHKRSPIIPVHTDAVQSFGKFPLNINGIPVDAFTASFHKIHGPPGVGLAVVRKSFIEGYSIPSLICGNQQNKLRGGTENTPYIAGALAAMEIIWDNRINKNKRLQEIKNLIIKNFNSTYTTMTYHNYRNFAQANPYHTTVKGKKLQSIKEIKIVYLSCTETLEIGNYTYLCVPNTLTISVVNNQADVCNIRLKNLLQKYSVILSIGSACNTKNKKASHVMDAIYASNEIRKGALRISFDDTITIEQINRFLEIFKKILANEFL